MKKFVSLLLSACTALSLSATLAACGDSEESKHTHTWNAGTLNNGVMTYTCDSCEETKTENKAALYQKVCTNIVSSVNALNYVAPTSATERGSKIAPLADQADLYIDARVYDYITVKGVIQFVTMLGDMMDNENFNITSAPVKFTASYAARGETFTAVLMYNFDEANDKVVMYWDVESVTGSVTTDIFLYMDVDYAFATDTLEGFTLHSLQSVGSMEMLISSIYADETLKVVDQTADLTSVKATVNGLSAELSAKADLVIDLQADFTAEYTAMMDIMNGGGNNS